MKELALICIFLFCINNITNAHTFYRTTRSDAIFIASPFGIQSDINSSNSRIINSFDINLTGYVPSIGLNYNTLYGTTIFGGIGIGNILQIQYGLQLEHGEMLMRIRSDVPLILLDTDNDGFLKYPIVGVYYLKSHKLDARPETFGVTLGVDTFEMIKGIRGLFKSK